MVTGTEIDQTRALLKIAEATNRLANFKKHEMWLMYHIHVDSLDRSPSKFLSEGFANIMATK